MTLSDMSNIEIELFQYTVRESLNRINWVKANCF